jgi:predicted nucleic acid-binding protein
VLPRACLDAGVINLYYQKDPPQKILQLFHAIDDGKMDAVIPESILVETFKILCVAIGKEFAIKVLNSVFDKNMFRFVPLSKPLIISAGKFKCQYREVLSYNDAILIATALQEKATIHTTEKELPKIQGVNVIKYTF